MRVYFFCVPPETGSQVPYQHVMLCLAEGLRELGAECYSNVDFWPLDPARSRYLVRHDPNVAPKDCAIVIVSDEWFIFGQPFPDMRERGDACWIGLDREDGSRLRSLKPDFRAFDFVLRTHVTRDTRYPSNVRPWAFGLSQRILRSTAGPARERRRELLVNWRHTANPHSIRLNVERSVLPRLASTLAIDTTRERQDEPPEDPEERLAWYETGRRHWPAYYERLRETAACAAFGGYFVTRWPRAKESFLSRLLKRALTKSRLQTHAISQWDSWRLWESFAAGCATLHVDLERYGCVLPVMPENWVHYIGFDLQHSDAAIDRIRQDPGLLERIGAAGRDWALAAYGPEAAARRVLDLIRPQTLME